ncbi:Eukaryotic translation initiation factor 2-alpha kinase [Phlyctochytrium bullatum]|nr:Eukaryotic translation initiation factor 2-alpha kinase [Phlyctochytrium bullatum]
MLGTEAIRTRQNDTNYVARKPTSEATASTAPAWRGTINPDDIKIQTVVVANTNCTIEKGRHQNLSVIVKRSTNRNRARDRLPGQGQPEVPIGVMGLVMQKCAMDLKDWSSQASANPSPDRDERMLHISEDITKGLTYINNLNIIHNDLKPRNVFVDRYNKPYIGDFGVATNRGEALPGYTRQYFDKESLKLIPDEVSDSWLLGATLWEFWSDEAFNVEEKIHLNHIRNTTIKDILTKLLRPRERRPSAKEILSLFDSTTVRSDYQTIRPARITSPQIPIPP